LCLRAWRKPACRSITGFRAEFMGFHFTQSMYWSLVHGNVVLLVKTALSGFVSLCAIHRALLSPLRQLLG
jgi:hypothetical protein